jgi:hypothetical protein
MFVLIVYANAKRRYFSNFKFPFFSSGNLISFIIGQYLPIQTELEANYRLCQDSPRLAVSYKVKQKKGKIRI